MAKHNLLGEKGEEAACLYLVRKGYEILARNVSMYGAEIDIVAEYHGTIAFVEVKTRSRASEEEALAAVNHEKRIRIIAPKASPDNIPKPVGVHWFRKVGYGGDQTEYSRSGLRRWGSR